jgi:hypothetical protein
MRHLSLTAAYIALFLFAAPAFAEGDNGNNKDNGNHYGNYGNNGNHYGNDGNKGPDDGDKGNNGKGGGNLTTPSPEAAIGLPALAAGVGAILYLRSRRCKAA